MQRPLTRTVPGETSTRLSFATNSVPPPVRQPQPVPLSTRVPPSRHLEALREHSFLKLIGHQPATSVSTVREDTVLLQISCAANVIVNVHLQFVGCRNGRPGTG